MVKGKVLYTGCSYTAGKGFSLEKNEPGLWVNLLHSIGIFSEYQLVNAGVTGGSNQRIFRDTIWNLGQEQFDYAIVEWTTMPRYEFHVGLEPENDTKVLFTPNAPIRDIKCIDVEYPSDYVKNIKDRFLALHHLHFEITTLLFYVNSLVNCAKKFNTKIFFVNGLCPWDKNYFGHTNNISPSQYTNYTKELINVTNRNKEDNIKLYNRIHKEYTQTGGIQEEYWLNLYTSMASLKIDTNEDNRHPGTKSNHLYFQHFNQVLEEKINALR